MSRVLLVTACLCFSAACASSGPAGGVETVAVYDDAEDVPCAYEVVRTIRGESDLASGGSLTVIERERAAVLGRVAARAGLDAVLVEPIGQGQGVQRRAVVAAGAPRPPRMTFAGEGLRYVDPACGGPP